MGHEGDWVGKNADLKKLAAGVNQFFKDDGFHEVRVDEDPYASWFQIQVKVGTLRTVVLPQKHRIHLPIIMHMADHGIYGACLEFSR